MMQGEKNLHSHWSLCWGVLEVTVSLSGQVRSGHVSGKGAPPAQNASL